MKIAEKEIHIWFTYHEKNVIHLSNADDVNLYGKTHLL